MNVLTLSGRLTAHPELKTTESPLSVCRFTVAVRDGRSKTYFLPVTAWRERAEFVARHFAKGARMEVVGKLTTNTWEDKAGKKHTAYEIMAEQVDFGERAPTTVETVDEELPF